jgi:opacity protein-like surface antigen
MFARRWLALSLAAAVPFTSVAMAQADNVREVGPEFGVDVVYQLSQDVGFDGGSRLDLEDDIGLTLTFAYTFNPKFTLMFALDWNNLDYTGTLQSASVPGLSADIRGEMETFTPRVNGTYYFMDGPITPFITGGLGWSFIDTNIPTGQVSVGCWWDPWYGQICTPYQPTLDVDGFAYQAGGGVRWDFADTFSATAAYNKSWVDLDRASSAPDVDQLRLGFVFRY